MEVHNNFSPLAFRKKESKATYEKWYAFGKNYAIPASANTLTPFQFTELNIPVFDPDTIEVEAVNEETGEATKTGVYVSFDVMPEHGGVLYVSPGKNSFREALPQGTYRARFSIGDGVYISTPFCVIPGIETSSKYLLIEYWNDEKIAYPGGFITTGANNDFRYQMYVPATICKPKYEFEEELTKRAGYKFLELQTSTKVYAFTFVAPEFICDAMRLIRLSDYIRISHDGEYYNALNFEFDVDWQEQLYLAAVDCQFETDSIIQKLPSFNRRDKASFYNALLANIDTPIMFSPDTVGLYYKEYRETEPVVKGKLIRELSPIDLIDENTTIAVDLGTGEARKFNLYRMLQDYISKAHEDATDFLLHLRGGATFGEGITGSAASINAVGDAEVQGLNARVTKVKSLDSEDYVTVNKTAFTVNKQGDTALNALNARGVSRLQQDVYTGNDTGKITKEGQLQYLSAIIQQFLSSPTFVSGFLGEGFKIWVENGNWHIECDNLTVRQTMNIFELLIQKIRSVNGALVVSQSNGKLSAVEEVGTQYKLTTGEEFPTFQEGDLVRCQTFAGYQGAGLTFDFTQFAKYDYAGSAFDSSLVDVTPDSISFNLNDTGNSGFAFYKFSESSPTPIEIPSFTLTLEGGYPGMMAIAAGLDSSDSPVESAGVLLQNGDNVIPAIKAAQGIHNFAIIITGDSGHGNGKVTVKQKKAAGSAPNNSLVKFYWVEVKRVEGTSFFADKSEFNNVVPAIGDEVVQMGNTKNAERQALIYITAQESGQPYIEILKGVNSKTLAGTNRTRLGDLNNIQDSAFPVDYQPHGSGLYSDNVWLKGIFLLRNNQTIEDYVKEKDDALKDYLDTEITAIPGKIELAVRSLKTANYNLLLDSNHTLSANPYQLGAYKYDVHLVKGKSYTLTVCYKCADSDDVVAYNNPSFGYLAILPKSAEETIVSTKITPSQDDAAYFYFYKTPQKETTQTYVRWAVITEGDIGVAAWIPSRTEVRTGIRNLFPISRMQTATNKQLNYFDITGWVATVYSEEEFKSRFKPSTKYTITGRYTMLGKPTAGTGYKDSSLAFCVWNGTNLINLWRKNVENEAVGTSGDILNTFTTPSNLDGYKIIVYTMYDSGNIGEFRFTDLMVSEGIEAVGWTQAPEDIEYDYRKYTDTQILAVDGKIELTVKTQLEKTTIGGNNLIDGSKGYWFDASDYGGNVSLNYNPASNGWMSVLGSGAFNCYKPWMNVDKTEITPGKQYTLGIDVSIGGNYVHETGLFFNIRYNEGGTTKFVADKTIVLTNDTKWTRYYVTLDLPSVLPSGITINDLFFLCGFTGNNTGTGAGLIVSYKNINLVEGGIGTSWSPSANDTFGKSVEYTNQQISIVEGKITTTVEKLTEVDGKVTGLASRVTQTENSITSVVGDINVLNSTTNRHVTKQIDLVGWDNNKFFPLVIDIPVGHKSKVEINRPLNHAYGRPSYGTHADGFSMNLSFEMSGSGWGSSIVVTNIFDYVRSWSNGKIVVDLGQITKSSKCVMGIRGGSKYDVTVYDTTDKSTVNVYQTDYTDPFGQVVPVRTDGTEPVRTYGYYSEIKQTQESISATVAKVDDQGRRLSAAELTLSADHAKLSVVETTANNANSLAGTANNKAEAADGRVTATQNGLVETGINITSRKIVLKSDNVLFQNNAGQQTAAINANGKLTANSIEVGEVVAGGFAAQRITTGNLTVTDGAVIGGMTITGGVLTGKNINIQDGARIGNFTIVSGIFSAQNTPAGIQMTLSNNAATFDSSGVRVEHNSGGYALTTTGNGRVFLTGSNFWVQCKDVDFMGVQTWKAPGVFYACTILANGAIGKTWGNPDFHITRVTKNSKGRYTVNTTGSNGDYFVMITAYDPSSWLSTTVEPYSEGQFTYKVFDVNNGMRDGGVIIYFCGMVK